MKEINYDTLPYDINAEQSVLGSMLLDNEVVVEVIEKLKPDDFYRKDNKEIYSAMLELYNQNKPIELTILTQQLTLNGVIDSIGGIEYLVSLTENPTVSYIKHYVKIVQDKSLLRKLIKTSNDVINICQSENMSVDSIAERVENKLFDALQSRDTSTASDVKDVLKLTLDSIQEKYNKKGALSGLSTGFYDLDYMTSGLNEGNMIIIGARPAMGKSAFALNIAQHVAQVQKVPVAIFSLEMSKEEVASRLISAQAEVDSKRIKNATLDDEEWLKIGRASSEISKAKIFIDDNPNLTAAALRAKCKKLKLEKNIGLVVIDYLQLMVGPEKSESRQQDVSNISRSLKILAKELKIPVIALCQLNRAATARENHTPNLSDIRESGSIEQDADIVMFLHREEYYNKETEKKNIAQVIIAKNRAGDTGEVELAFIGKYTKFKNLAREQGE